MKFLFLITLVFSQTVYAQIDKDVYSIDEFRALVKKIEFVEVLPICDSVYRYNNDEHAYNVSVFCDYFSIIEPSKTVKEAPQSIELNRIGKKELVKQSDFNQLFELLYNRKSDQPANYCYEPRHGICFYGEGNEFIGFLEICFECSNTLSTHQVPLVQNISSSGFKLLRGLFTTYGLN